MSSTALKFHRFIAGYSQQKLAENTGLTQSRISRLERDVASGSQKNVEAKEAISKFLGIDKNLLFPGEGQP